MSKRRKRRATKKREQDKTNYTSPISLEELAYLSGRSLSSFKRDFQSIYNTTPAKWIREKRLSKAHQMLQSSQMSVAEVAYSLGFENPTHFSRIFKQQYGISPISVVDRGLNDGG